MRKARIERSNRSSRSSLWKYSCRFRRYCSRGITCFLSLSKGVHSYAKKEQEQAKVNEERVKDNMRKARIEKLTQEEIHQQQHLASLTFACSCSFLASLSRCSLSRSNRSSRSSLWKYSS
jgi:hypothetical protein